MSEKHYNAAYLEDTAKILKGIKMNSYQYFSAIESGTVLDLGCGTGMDVINMAQVFSNRFKVIGVDHDESLINIARKSAEGKEGVDFIVSEGSKLPFESSSVEGVRAERLVQHLPEPKSVFDEINRVLKSQASVVIIESDWSSLCFYSENVTTGLKITNYLTEQKINNGWAPKQLVHYFEQSDFVNPTLNVYPFVLTSLQDAYTYLWIDKIIAEMTEKGILSQEEKNTFTTSIEIADKNKCFACSMNIVIGTAQKQ